MADYKVQHYLDDIYQVIEHKLIQDGDWGGYDDYYGDETVFKGTLADCEAWLRLNERGYM